jgi:arylsulfatase A-like enzyme
MLRKNKMNAILIFLSFFLVTVLSGVNTAKPNIILINVDDMGWTDIAAFGSEYYQTPNMDRLIAEGMKFSNAYAGAANCAPSRACLISGQSSPRHGVYTVGSSERGKPQQRKLIPTKNQKFLPPTNAHYWSRHD